MAKVTLKIEGMHCGSCIRRVTQAIHSAGPYSVDEVRLGAARYIAAENTPTSNQPVIAALARAGFPAQVEG